MNEKINIQKIINPSLKQSKHQWMTIEQAQNEKDYRICLHIIKSMYELKLITKKEAINSSNELIKVFHPIIGGLCSEEERF